MPMPAPNVSQIIAICTNDIHININIIIKLAIVINTINGQRHYVVVNTKATRISTNININSLNIGINTNSKHQLQHRLIS